MGFVFPEGPAENVINEHIPELGSMVCGTYQDKEDVIKITNSGLGEA